MLGTLVDLEQSDTVPSESVALPTLVSLFSGAGGLDLGFRRAGFTLGFATDLASSAMDTHRRNFPGVPTLVADLLSVSAHELADEIAAVISPGSPIGILGGPPCQGFSRSNHMSRTDDPRNALAQVYVQVVNELSERFDVAFTVFENVPGLKSTKHRSAYEAVIAGLRRSDLDVSEHLLLATDFGVPQTRKRVILVGLNAKLGLSLPAFESVAESPCSTVEEAIGVLAEPMFYARGLDPTTFPTHENHWTMRPVSDRFRNATWEGSGRSFRKLDWHAASPTIAFGHREIHVHPNGNRRISIFEAMRLQGFPDEFVLKGTLSQQVEQVSNAVPPPVAESIAVAIRSALEAGEDG